VGTALEAIPGALIGMAIIYFEGARRQRRNTDEIGPS
jgi:hypothetical protein